MNKDHLSTLTGLVITCALTVQPFLPPHTPWYVHAALAVVCGPLAVWIGVKAYQPPGPRP